MYQEQALQMNPDEITRCEEQKESTDHGKSLSPIQKTDAAIETSIYNALWKDEVLRALDYYEMDVHVINGVVYLNGHIAGTSSQNRVNYAIQAIPGILGIKNNLVLDDKLTCEVAASLGELEHTYHCKFFTGVSHGVVLLNGEVGNPDVRMRAEKCAGGHPKVRGVINNIRVPGFDLGVQDHRFLQPSIGKKIYFRDGISGFVSKIVINPDNRRVVAMIIRGSFDESREYPTFLNNNDGRSLEQQLVIPMSVVKQLTNSSGFLNIPSNDFTKYQAFDTSRFILPNNDWMPPYPYCPDDVLFPIAYLKNQASAMFKVQAMKLQDELLYNDSLGG
jgi:osmotically-inducible protein OsmY